MDNLKNILAVLAEAEIDFVIIGGVAAILHGSAQVTQDIDILTSLTPDSVERLRSCLKPYHPVHRHNTGTLDAPA